MPATTAAPVLSVILVCKNPGPRLHAALASVWEQHQIHPEIIVIDGASTDGSREWLTSQRARLATLVSEPDAGRYHAMNRGVALATGEWLLFLGADDRLVGDMVLSESLIWMNKTEAGIAVGEIAYHDGRISRLRSDVNPCARNFVPSQGTFYRRSLFAENDAFDTSLVVMAAYEFNVRLWKNRVRFKPIPLRIAACGTGGVSDSGSWRSYREEITVRHRYFSFGRCLVWDAFTVVRYVRKKIARSFSRH
jgi:glycosyltransferase involved in cell wall biosynthesis